MAEFQSPRQKCSAFAEQELTSTRFGIKAQANAKKENVANLVSFRNEDLFEADIHDATVVTLYLLPSINLKLRPTLQRS